MFVAKKALQRRTFLRGIGATVALPLLDAMVPALSAKSVKPTPRLGFIYIANGVIQNQWIPTATGRAFELSPILKPLEPLRNYVNILSGLSHLQADTFGDGTGDHPRSSAVWLTGVHAYDRSRPDIEVRLATSADQIAAREIGKGTETPSVEMNLDPPTQGACDTSDCFFNNTISWHNPTTPNPAESHPRIVFERLFGDGGSAAQRLARMKRNGSILDSVMQEVSSLDKTLGPGDRTKLREYLESVREIEQRIQSVEARGIQSIELPERPTDVPANFDEYIKLMYDLQALGFQADITRVFTMIVARELSTRTYPQIGVNEAHHPVSHHMDNPIQLAKLAKINAYHVSLFGYFLEKLKATPDGEGTLLDHSMYLLGSGLGNPNAHDHSNLPILVAGGGAGKLKGGRHIKYAQPTPLTNLLVTLLDKSGIKLDRFADSTGRVNELIETQLSSL